MLQDMRKSSASIFIYIIFGILIAVFVLNFGPQANRSNSGCGAEANTALVVNGQNVSRNGYGVAYQLLGGPSSQRRMTAFDLLIRRELLAQEAEARGLRVSDAAVDQAIREGSLYFHGGERYLTAPGTQTSWKDIYFDKVGNDYFFNYNRFANLVEGSWQLRMGAFKEAMRREMQAGLLADLLQSGVAVSRDEAYRAYMYEHTTATLDVVKFMPGEYRTALRPTEADVKRFASAHEAELKTKFTTDERLYKDTKPQALVRLILRKAEAAPPTPSTNAAPASTTGAPGADAAVAKLNTLRSEISSGKRSFADAAAALSEDAESQSLGGSVGWVSVENPSLGDAALNDAVKALKAGELSSVVSTPKGAYLLTVEATRQGNLTFEQVKDELALELAREQWSKEAAKRAALAALARAKTEIAAGKKLSDVFAAPTTKTGARYQSSETVPAAWYAQAAEATGSATPAAPTTTATPATATDSSATNAATAPVVTATGASAEGANTTQPAGSSTITASNETLPTIMPVTATSNRIGPAPRMAKFLEFGEAPALIAALFDTAQPGALLPDLYPVGEGFAIVQLIERGSPDVKAFEKEADQRMEWLRIARAERLLNSWVVERCDALLKDKKIAPTQDYLRESDEQGNTVMLPYKPCQMFRSNTP